MVHSFLPYHLQFQKSSNEVTISSKINDIKQDNISLNLNTDNKKDTIKDKLGSSTLETTDKKDNSANVKVIRNIEDDKPTPKPRSVSNF
jgi:hypothetical protein